MLSVPPNPLDHLFETIGVQLQEPIDEVEDLSASGRVLGLRVRAEDKLADLARVR